MTSQDFVKTFHLFLFADRFGFDKFPNVFLRLETFCSLRFFVNLTVAFRDLSRDVMDSFCSALLCVTLKGKKVKSPEDPNLDFETDELFSLCHFSDLNLRFFLYLLA